MQFLRLLQLLIKEQEIRNLNINLDKEVLGIANDSRLIKPGYIFVAINGHKLDGHFYVHDAINNGAIAIITERYVEVNNQIVQVNVKCAREALSRLSNFFFKQPSKKIKTIGVTGTNGKTTTTYLIKAVLENANRKSNQINSEHFTKTDAALSSKVGLIGTIGYVVGNKVLQARETTPDSVVLQEMLAQMVNLDINFAVMEVSSQAIIQCRTHDIDFNAATFTNLTPEHLDYHSSFSEYRAAKSILFERLNHDSFALLNADDDAGKYFANRTKANVVWYGIEKSADVRCKIINFHSDFTDIIISYNNKDFKVRLPMIGLHNVYNTLAAVANGIVFNVDIETILEGICSINNIPGRLERIDCGQSFKVFIDYAHTEHALDTVLRSLRHSKFDAERLLLVFGCGGDRDKGKRAKMGEVANKFADRFWITNDNPRSEDSKKIIEQIMEGVKSNSSFSIQPDRRLAIKEAITEANAKDIVLIAGKGHETGQIIGKKILQFNDKKVAKEILLKLRN